MARTTRPLFLARRTYRRRRLMDVGRLMPFVGAFLFLLPILWAGSAKTSTGLIYLFSVWGLLIIGLLALSRPIRRAEADPEASLPDAIEDVEER